MSDLVKEVTDATFEELVLKSTQPVLVDFWAEWCGPCRTLAPYYEKTAQRLSNKVVCCKYNYNTDQMPKEMAQRYRIEFLPTLILFRNGTEKKRAVGGVKVAKLLNAIATELGV